ncbi:MAG: HNH endonuclease [Alphaproteobacteria bacterium]
MKRRRYRPYPRSRAGAVLSLMRRVPGLRPVVFLIAVALAILSFRQSPFLVPVAIPYDRALYEHWIDSDGDCQDTRAEVLIARSETPVQLSADGCRVTKGRWRDAYSGIMITDPTNLDIDHRIPLAEAHRSGADKWTAAERQAFANAITDPDVLVITQASTNRSKADGDPASWLPLRGGQTCPYIAAWVRTKSRWHLTMDPIERGWVGVLTWLCAS